MEPNAAAWFSLSAIFMVLALIVSEVEGGHVCDDGLWGEDCEKHCADGCSICDEATGECMDCVAGVYGKKCDMACSQNCSGTCDSSTGACTNGCVAGHFGTACDKYCPEQCYPQRCDQEKGHCTKGCKAGYYGEQCKKHCPGGCLKNCNTTTGMCMSCSPGIYGMMCNHHCSQNCEGEECEQASGKCLGGCIEGFTGDTCNEVVPPAGAGGGVDAGAGADADAGTDADPVVVAAQSANGPARLPSASDKISGDDGDAAGGGGKEKGSSVVRGYAQFYWGYIIGSIIIALIALIFVACFVKRRRDDETVERLAQRDVEEISSLMQDGKGKATSEAANQRIINEEVIVRRKIIYEDEIDDRRKVDLGDNYQKATLEGNKKAASEDNKKKTTNAPVVEDETTAEESSAAYSNPMFKQMRGHSTHGKAGQSSEAVVEDDLVAEESQAAYASSAGLMSHNKGRGKRHLYGQKHGAKHQRQTNEEPDSSKPVVEDEIVAEESHLAHKSPVDMLKRVNVGVTSGKMDGTNTLDPGIINENFDAHSVVIYTSHSDIVIKVDPPEQTDLGMEDEVVPEIVPVAYASRAPKKYRFKFVENEDGEPEKSAQKGSGAMTEQTNKNKKKPVKAFRDAGKTGSRGVTGEEVTPEQSHVVFATSTKTMKQSAQKKEEKKSTQEVVEEEIVPESSQAAYSGVQAPSPAPDNRRGSTGSSQQDGRRASGGSPSPARQDAQKSSISPKAGSKTPPSHNHAQIGTCPVCSGQLRHPVEQFKR